MIKLKPTSWKIMLEILVKANPTKVMEVPIVFEKRHAGESKFNWAQMRAYIRHLVHLGLIKYRSMIRFGLIGLVGAGMHFGLLYAFTEYAGMWYIASAIISIVIASTNNYFLNHRWTFKGRKIENHLIGWTKYQGLSGASDAVYIGMLALFVEIGGMWYMAGAVLAAVIIFPVKYFVAATMIWREEKKDPNSADYDWKSFYQGGAVQKWWKQKVANIVWEFVPEGSAVLDVGCGSSPVISQYDNATGVDISKEKLDYLKSKIPSIKTAVMDATKLTFENNSFDNVLCTEVLEHLHNPEEAIAQIARVLKPGGRAVIATPDYSRKWWLLAEKFTPAGEQHVSKFTRKSLEAMCKKYKLVPIKHKYVAGCDLCELFKKE